MPDKKRSVKKTILLILSLFAAAALAALPFALDRMNGDSGDGASILSAEVTRTDLSRTISCAGVVGDKDPVKLNIPTDVVITGYAVSDGDLVYAGAPVAYVDTVSVYKLAASLGEELESVTNELSDVQNTWASSYISSTVEGIVTSVYARPGDDIRSVMFQYGALAKIQLEDGTRFKITATSGTVLNTFIQEGDEIYVNATLFSVSDVDSMSAYGALVLRHQKLQETIGQLFQMYRDGYAAAPSDGMIVGTDETLVTKLSSAGDPTGGIELLSYSASPETVGQGYVKLSDEPIFETPKISYAEAEVLTAPDADGFALATVYKTDQTVDARELPNIKQGDTVLLRVDYDVIGDDGVLYPLYFTAVYLLKSSNSGSTGGKSGGMSGGMGGSGGGGTSVSSDIADVISLNTVASVVPMDEALVNISVDELDILSLHEGDRALVTIDALPGRSFDGVVTNVNAALSNNGGNSKYTAEVTIARTPDILDGMNVSCLVTIETYKDVLSIPAAALYDEDGVQLVYTELSRDKSALSMPVPVAVGYSDGMTLEIRSGLSVGDTVWYKTFDTPEYSVSAGQTRNVSSIMRDARRSLRGR